MGKIKLKISDMFCRFCTRTVADALTGPNGVQRAKMNQRAGEAPVSFDTWGIISAYLTKIIRKISFGAGRKIVPLSLGLMGSILIILLSITGCADVPYTGPILKVKDVEKFLNSRDENAACIEDGFDSVCIKLVSDKSEVRASDSDAPVIHVHPTSLSYLFYYEDEPILLAERVMDTTQIVQELIDTGKIQAPPNGSVWRNNNDSDIQDVWVVQIYYPEVFLETNRRLRSRDIRVVEGNRIRRDSRWDLEVENFIRDGNNGVQFSIETKASQIAIQVEDLVPDHSAEFYIDADEMETDSSTNALRLRPL